MSCYGRLIYLVAGSALRPLHTTVLLRGVSSEQTQNTAQSEEQS